MAGAKKVLLVGESNPYSADPDHALLPWPKTAAGWRLCDRILGMSEKEYLRVFARRNLLPYGTTKCASKPTLAGLAHALLDEQYDPRAVVALGKMVATAFALALKLPYVPDPFDVVESAWRGPLTLLVLPHPSGRSREWNAHGSMVRAKALVGELLDGV